MTRHYNIVGYRRIWYLFSAVLLTTSIVATGLWGLKLGIDFTGGSLLEVSYLGVDRPAPGTIVATLPETFGEVIATPVGDQGMVLRLRDLTEEEHQALLATLRDSLAEGGSIQQERFTTIGPTIGTELRQKALWALGFVLGGIVLYVAWAFRKVSRPVKSWQYGAAAIFALFHDVIITVGIFAALGHFLGVEVGTLFITALLTVLGFSVHDTIVVFDRVRENLGKSNERFPAVVNQSLNETMTRSLNTSFTTLLVLLFILFFGGESMRWFVLALSIGIVFGTYSSVFVGAPLLVSWFRWREQHTGLVEEQVS